MLSVNYSDEALGETCTRSFHRFKAVFLIFLCVFVSVKADLGSVLLVPHVESCHIDHLRFVHSNQDKEKSHNNVHVYRYSILSLLRFLNYVHTVVPS